MAGDKLLSLSEFIFFGGVKGEFINSLFPLIVKWLPLYLAFPAASLLYFVILGACLLLSILTIIFGIIIFISPFSIPVVLPFFISKKYGQQIRAYGFYGSFVSILAFIFFVFPLLRFVEKSFNL